MPSETPPPKIPSPSASVSVLEQQQRPKTPSSVPPVSSTPSSFTQTSSHLNPNCHQSSNTTIASQEQLFSSLPTTSTSSSSTQQQQQQQQNHSEPQQFCLKWNSYQSNLTSEFDQLLQNESFVDVTLACDGHSIKAHKMVLSACSPYFQALFFDNPCQHPIIIMKEVKWPELKAVVEYMYKGEINVSQDQIAPLLRVAQMLKIRGLADVNGDQDVNASASTTNTGSSNNGQQQASSGKSESNVNVKKPRLARDFDVHERNSNGAGGPSASGSSGGTSTQNRDNSGENLNTASRTGRKRRWLTGGENQTGAGSPVDTSTPDNLEPPSPIPLQNHPSTSITHPPTSTPTPTMPFPVPPHLDTMGLSSLALNNPDDMEIKPGIAEMIREEERAKLLENSHAWLGASTSSIADYPNLLKLKTPMWTQQQLKDAISAVVTQKMRFTQASVRYNIPKGTLYDNILGKSNRMQVLEEAGLDATEENAVLEFCCDVSVSPYNRRTKKSLASILEFVQKLKQNHKFQFSGKSGFRWWWAFCKKYSIVSLHYDGGNTEEKCL